MTNKKETAQEVPVHMDIDKCKTCKELNKAIELMNVFKWRAGDNYLSALAYERGTETILIDEESLMRAIQLANPHQKYRKVKLITREEHTQLKRGHILNATSVERTAPEVLVQEQLDEISNGYKTINQVRKEYGLELIEGGDICLTKVQSRTMLLETLLGNDVTIFLKENGLNSYELEIADSKNRVKLLTMNLNRLSKSRYYLLNYQSF